MPVPLPTAATRWRCTQCGNLTRFDVTRSTRVVEFVHLDLVGEPRVEETEVLSETVESVRCRWCNALDQVELVDRPDGAATGHSAQGRSDCGDNGGMRRRPEGSKGAGRAPRTGRE